MYYKVRFLEKGIYSEQELNDILGTKVPVYDYNTNEIIDYEEFTQQDYKLFNINPFEWVKVFEVNSINKLDKLIEEEIEKKRTPINKIEVIDKREVDVQELIEDELKYLYSQMFKQFFHRELETKKMNANDFSELKDKYLNEPRSFYELLKYQTKTNDVEDYLGRNSKWIKQMDCSVGEYFTKVKKLVNSKSESIGE